MSLIAPRQAGSRGRMSSRSSPAGRGPDGRRRVSDRWRRGALALVSSIALAGGLWAVAEGWGLRTVHRHAEAARDHSSPMAGEVVARDRIAGVELDVVRFDTGRIEVPARVLPPETGRPAIGEGTAVRVVMPETARYGQPLYAADYVRGASDERLETVGRRAMALLVVGFGVTITAAFVLSSALSFLWPDPKRRTRWHYDRYGG